MCFGPGKYFMTVFSVFVLHFFIKSVNKNVQLISQHFFIIPTCVCIIDHWNNFVGLRQKLHTLHAFLRGKKYTDGIIILSQFSWKYIAIQFPSLFTIAQMITITLHLPLLHSTYCPALNSIPHRNFSPKKSLNFGIAWWCL